MNHWCIKSDGQRINNIFPNNIDMICFQVRTITALHKYIAWENFVVQGRFIVQKGYHVHSLWNWTECKGLAKTF